VSDDANKKPRVPIYFNEKLIGYADTVGMVRDDDGEALNIQMKGKLVLGPDGLDGAQDMPPGMDKI
jgi:hypothetical protein